MPDFKHADVPIIGAKQGRPFDYCIVTPYMHPDPCVMHARAVAASKMAAHMIAQSGGTAFVICPVAYVHTMVAMAPQVQAFGVLWEYFATVLLDLADALIVLKQPGYETAPDVRGPIARAKQFSMEVVYADVPEHLVVDPATVKAKREDRKKQDAIAPRN